MRIAGGALLGNYACYTQATGNEVTALGHGADFITLSAGQTSQSMDLDECKRYLLEVQYPGERVFDQDEDDPYAFGIGYCTVRHRIWLYGN
jgi:hypothetical protein